MEKNINDVIRANEKLIGYTVKTYFPQEIGNEDIWQIGLIGLWKAVETYDEKHNTKFETFAITIIKRKIISYIRNKTRLKRNDTDKIIRETEELSYLEMIKDNDINSNVEFKTELNNLWRDFEDKEREVLSLKVKGKTNKEIAEELKLSEKTIRRRMQNIRNKFDDYI